MAQLGAPAVRDRPAHGGRLAAVVPELLAVLVHWLAAVATLRGRAARSRHAHQAAARAAAGVLVGALVASRPTRAGRDRRAPGHWPRAVRPAARLRLPDVGAVDRRLVGGALVDPLREQLVTRSCIQSGG